MSGIDDLNFEDLVDGAINTIDDARTERYEAHTLIQPKAKPKAKVIIQPEPTVESPAPRKKRPPKTPAGGTSATFEHIYSRAGVDAGEFTIFRLEQLYNDEDLRGLDEHARVAAVRAILKSHGVDLDTIVEDAVARKGALEAHDRRLKSNIERVDNEMERENARLQAEIEEYANPRIEQMEKNAERIERLHRDYLDWGQRMQSEESRLAAILQPWGGDPRLTISQGSFKPDTLVEPAVSGDDAFEPIPEQDAPTREADIYVPEQALQWADEPSHAEQELGGHSSAALDEPSFSAAAATSEVSEAYDSADGFNEDELDFAPAKLRFPRTAGQWLFTLLTLAVALFASLLLAASLTMMMTPGVLVFAVAVPFAVAFVFGLATDKRSFWKGPVVIWMLLSLICFAGVHAYGDHLVKNLTKRPLWFIDEAGISTEVENAVYMVTGPYAEAVAPVLGVQDSIWKAPAKAPASKGPAAKAPAAKPAKK